MIQGGGGGRSKVVVWKLEMHEGGRGVHTMMRLAFRVYSPHGAHKEGSFFFLIEVRFKVEIS